MKKTLLITQTAVLTAMLVLLQSVTKAGGQFVTGSCVNAVLAVAAGNVVYVLILHVLLGKKSLPIWRQGLGLVCGAVCKVLTLYLLVAQLLCRVLPLPEKQIATFTKMFSWPQLITALIGGGVALLIVPILRKAFRR